MSCPPGEGFDVADLDDDSDPDIIIGSRWYETPSDVANSEWVEHVFSTTWTNRPKSEDPTIQHRANKPVQVMGPGLYYATVPVTTDWHGPGYDPDPPMPWP